MTKTTIIALAAEDRDILKSFTNSHAFIQRHLDWRVSEDWLGQQPFMLLNIDGDHEALLACPSDPPGIAWIRFFACRDASKINQSFATLLEACLEWYGDNQPVVAAVALHKWYETLLRSNGFKSEQRIIVLEKIIDGTPTCTPHPDLHIRPMTPADFDAIEALDQASFEPLWRLSAMGIKAAFSHSTYATVGIQDDAIVGYQISNINLPSAHLSRLAVLPAYRGKRIGQDLVSDLVAFYYGLGANQITVNTQDNNPHSVYLYEKLGFRRLESSFPVLRYAPD